MVKNSIYGKEITYYKREELDELNAGPEREFYLETYRLAENISKQLQVDCPHIGFSNSLTTCDSNNRISKLGAVLFPLSDIPSLENNLILLSLDFDENPNKLFQGTLAHEMRHLWQYKYVPEMNKHPAVGFGESLMHPAEIDADGYAIWYLAQTYNISFEEAACIMCPEEKKHYPKAYQLRIEKVNEINTFYNNKNVKTQTSLSNERKKATILEKLKNLLVTRR